MKLPLLLSLAFAYYYVVRYVHVVLRYDSLWRHISTSQRIKKERKKEIHAKRKSTCSYILNKEGLMLKKLNKKCHYWGENCLYTEWKEKKEYLYSK